jgi:hypothetical protein
MIINGLYVYHQNGGFKGSNQTVAPILIEEPVAPILTEKSNETVAPILTEGSNQTVAPILTEGSNQTVAPILTEGSNQTVAPILTEKSNQTVAPILTVRKSKRFYTVDITIRPNIRIRPGQFVYIRLLNIRSIFESHPYMIAWSEPDKNTEPDKKPNKNTELEKNAESQTIRLFIKSQNGFSRRLPKFKNSRILIHGPFGAETNFDGYDKILLVSQGIGIAAHLLLARYLLYAYDKKIARVRRLTLIWYISNKGKSN